MNDNLLIDRINQQPTVLILGQRYFNEFYGPFKSIFEKKFSLANKASFYDCFMSLNRSFDENLEILGYCDSLLNEFPGNDFLDTIKKIHWSHVFTSNIDSSIISGLESSWRKIQPIYNSIDKVDNIRSKFNLKISFLFGCINQITPENIPPYNRTSKIRRSADAQKLANRLPEIATPLGTIIVDKIDFENDWLSFETVLYPLLKGIESSQILIFGVDSTLLNNDCIQDLSNSDNILFFEEELEVFINRNEKKIRKELPFTDEDDNTKWVISGPKKLRFPSEVWSSFIDVGEVLDDSLKLKINFSKNQDRLEKLESFLKVSSIHPQWQGYANNMDFKRSFLKDVYKCLDQSIYYSGDPIPLIIHGQSSVGKTVGLGRIAFDIAFSREIVTLYIDRRKYNLSIRSLDEFCRRLEREGATFIFIVWDGMFGVEKYYDVLDQLRSRGRKVGIIGSSYKLNNEYANKSNFVEVSAVLDKEERSKFDNYLYSINPILASSIDNQDYNSNILVALYQFVKSSRNAIDSGIVFEKEYYVKTLSLYLEKENSNELDTNIFTDFFASQLDIKPSLFSDNEKGSRYRLFAQKIINYIMIPGQYNVYVPLGFIARLSEGYLENYDLYRLLNQIDIIICNEDSEGNLYCMPRTSLEAKLLVRRLGGINSQIEYINDLIRTTYIPSYSVLSKDSGSIEVNFLVNLLVAIGPNSPYSNQMSYHYYSIVESLKDIRENSNVYHPRLILQEATLLREIVKSKYHAEKDYKDLLIRGETILRDCLSIFVDDNKQKIYSYLSVELASTLGAKLMESKNDKSYQIEYPELLFKEIVRTVESTRRIDVDNYYALDVYGWAMISYVNQQDLSAQEKLILQSDIFHQFSLAEIEGIPLMFRDQFLLRKGQLYEVFGNIELSQDVFQKLLDEGSTVGIYYKALQITNNIQVEGQLNEKDRDSFYQAYQFLLKYEDLIMNDPKCIHLLLKSFWFSKVGKPFFFQEREKVTLRMDEWENITHLIELMMHLDPLYKTRTLLFILAVGLYHQEHYETAQEKFKELDELSSYGVSNNWRLRKSYILCDEDGNEKIFSGESKSSLSSSNNEKFGKLFIPTLRRYVGFQLRDFNLTEIEKGERVTNFAIAFNFIGPVAIPKL